MKTMFLDIKHNFRPPTYLVTKTQRQLQRWQKDLLVACMGQRPFIWISDHPSTCSQIQIGTTTRKIDKFQNYENDVFGHKTQLSSANVPGDKNSASVAALAKRLIGSMHGAKTFHLDIKSSQ